MSDHDPHPGQPGTSPPPVAEAVAQAQVIAGALAAAVVVYAVVAWLVVEFFGHEVLAGGLPAPLPGVLVTVAAALLLLAPAVERRMLARSRRPASAAPPDDLAERYRTAKVAGFALRELAAVVGLVVGLTTGEPRWTWGISAGTLLLMGLAWPRASDLPPGTGTAVAPR